MATTTNYNWATPDDTDLVKDGASAIRTLGSSADTTVKNLNPGTTAGDIDYYTSSTAKARIGIGTIGQVLRVNSGATAPEWATIADQTPLTTKGDLFTFDTADARLGVGADGTVLTADSAETTGLKWAAPAGVSYSGVSVKKTANQSISTATFTAITFDSEDYDVGGYHDNSTNNSRLTIPAAKDGYYSLTGMVRFAQNSTGNRAINLYKNGVEVGLLSCIAGIATNPTVLAFSFSTSLVATDYLQLFAYQTSSGNLNVDSGLTNWQLNYLGA